MDSFGVKIFITSTLILLFCFLEVRSQILREEKCNKYGGVFTKVLNGFKLTKAKTLRVENVQKPSTCIGHCLYNNNCKTISHSTVENKCLLHASIINEKDGTLEASSGWVFYGTEESTTESIGTICLKTSPCQHGKCIDQCKSPGYQCICDTGYSGDNCEFYDGISACTSCVHGDCEKRGISNYKCICKVFSSGKSCDKISLKTPQFPTILPYMNMSKPFKWSAEIQTTIQKAVIVANAWLPTPSDARPCALWKDGSPSQGKMLFISEGKLIFDIGWIGFITFEFFISDGNWHSIGLRYENGSYELTVDNVRSSGLWTRDIVTDHPDHVTVLGYDISETLCGSSMAPEFKGEIRNIKYKPV